MSKEQLPEEVFESYIHLSKYSKFREEENRRETWEETVSRYTNFFRGRHPELKEELDEVHSFILEKKVAPSMRGLATAGPALTRCNTVGYNCCAIGVDHPRVFDEIFYLLMGGSGVGFSVMSKHIEKLPIIAESFHDTKSTIVVQDSRTGWAKALKELVSLLYAGDVPKFDVSLVRPAGARLRTHGGRASGPQPLLNLFNTFIRVFKGAKGRRLNSLEVHDLCCTIADTVIVGSVRRSACISFSDVSDERMRGAKSGQWYLDPNTATRALANNSAMYLDKPDLTTYMKEMRGMYTSKSGERGIVNQEALRSKAERTGREHDGMYILNPCGEVILRDSGGFCCLTEVIVRSTDTLEDLKEKVRVATIIGTLQCTLTDFKYIRKIWQKNAEEERLLGVSLTGIMDHGVMSGMNDKHFNKELLKHWLQQLKQVAIDTNKEWSKKLGINESKQLSAIKPSGTVSSLMGTSSGIHPRYAPFYIRRATQDVKDPLTQLMIDQGIPHVVVKDKVIFEFVIKSPTTSVTRDMLGPIEQLEIWKIYAEEWCDGNPSQTIYYSDSTFLSVVDWVYKHWDSVVGLSFFPGEEGQSIYANAPFQECTEEEYNQKVAAFPEVDFSKLINYEKNGDEVGVTQEYACSGDKCELI